MMSVGVGIRLSNAKAVMQGFTHRQFEFRRTPKYSVIEKDKSWKKKEYRSRNPLAAFVEVAFAIYFQGAVGAAYYAEAVGESSVYCAFRFRVLLRGLPYGFSQYVAKEFGVSQSVTELTASPFF